MIYFPNQKTEKTDAKIKAALYDVLEKTNYNNLTIQMLIDQAKISRSTFYQHYPNKEFLVQIALGEFIDEQSEVMNDLIKNGMNENEILLMTLDILNRYKKQYRTYEKIEYSLVKDRPWNLLRETAIARINQANTNPIYRFILVRIVYEYYHYSIVSCGNLAPMDYLGQLKELIESLLCYNINM